MSHDITGFTFRGLTPHKLMPMPGVPPASSLDRQKAWRQVTGTLGCNSIHFDFLL
ncbi:MAG: hypothetical protein SVY10_13735 [Thermodesulfobacteriota bacterium]|nr:hypothetical protein [Thermodesulfobacteriota bacterium]